MPSVPLDLLSLARSVVGRLRTGRTAQVDVEGGTHVIVGDREQLERVVLNLVDNATHAGARSILIRTGQVGTDVVLEVHDDGPGFDPTFLPHAFERFSRADRARSRGDCIGTGLGLAIVAAIVRSHAGQVGAHNGSDLGGAKVVVRLPVQGRPDLTGRAAPYGGQIVVLQARPARATRRVSIGHRTTGARTGAVTFQVTQRTHLEQYRLVLLAAGGRPASESGVVTVKRVD